jgi:C4-dicarboxylate transporter DctM subunit
MLILFLIFFLLMILLGVPVAFVLGGTGIAIMIWQGIFNPVSVSHIMYQGLDSFPFLAVPFFMLAGSVMEEAQITKRLMDFAYSLVGRFRGGLAHVAILVAMIFAAMCGSAVATAAAVGALLLPTMNARGYDRGFSAALIASGGAIGPIIPPSIPMIIYAVIAGVSVERMFLGGVVPGVMFGVSLMLYSTYVAKRDNLAKETEKLDFSTFIKNLKSASLPLFLPVIILGGIFSGLFTATESSVMAVVYALFLGLVVYRSIKVTALPRVFLSACRNTAIIMFILSCCAVLNWVLTSQQIPQQIASAILASSSNPTLVMMMVMGLVLILGCFMDALAIILLLSPLCLVVMKDLGIDPVFFGVLLVVNVCVGALTPPVGTCLFVASKVGDVSLVRTSKAVIPMVALACLVMILCVLFPDLVMFLPRVVLGN